MRNTPIEESSSSENSNTSHAAMIDPQGDNANSKPNAGSEENVQAHSGAEMISAPAEQSRLPETPIVESNAEVSDAPGGSVESKPKEVEYRERVPFIATKFKLV